MDSEQLDQLLGRMIETWTTRDVDDDQCRFCNERLDEAKPPTDRYCDAECEERMDKVFEARIALGKRDMDQRGFD